MSNQTYLADAKDCPPGACLEVIVSGRVIAVFNVDGDFFALDGICPHQGGPLGKGQLEDGVVTCPWHGWQFRVSDGTCLISDEIKQPKIAVDVVSGQIFASLD